LSQTGHDFWAFSYFKEWKTKYASIPPNYHVMDKSIREIPSWLDFDLVLAQNRFDQFRPAKEASLKLGIPLVTVEHTLPLDTWSPAQTHQLRSMLGDVNVFVSEFQREAWGFPPDFGQINHTGIDIERFKNLGIEREKVCLSVNNDWINRDVFLGYRLWKEIVGNVLPVRVVGDTPGLSEPAKNTEELVQHYNTAAIYLNTTTRSSLPTVIMEAMACETPVVSTATCLIPQIMIKHGENGFVSNNIYELRRYCNLLLTDEELRLRMGKAARKTVEEKFSQQLFINKWNKILEEAC
jgi:glycosyltransferase involved in cell wall biosynthesis